MNDLSSVKPNTQTVHIVHPGTGDRLGLSIDVLPESSPEVKKQQRKNSDERLQKGRKLTAKWVEESYSKVLRAAVAGWAWEEDASFHGDQPECTPENIAAVFDELPWIEDQVREAYEDTEAFFIA